MPLQPSKLVFTNMLCISSLESYGALPGKTTLSCILFRRTDVSSHGNISGIITVRIASNCFGKNAPRGAT